MAAEFIPETPLQIHIDASNTLYQKETLLLAILMWLSAKSKEVDPFPMVADPNLVMAYIVMAEKKTNCCCMAVVRAMWRAMRPHRDEM